jgi:hypothetical protein
MSKKTIEFKMPPVEAARRDPEPSAMQSRAPAETDQWVRRGDGGEAAAPSATGASVFAVDLARERDFGEAVMLGAALPAMLGWFWLANAIERYRKILAD